MTAFPRETWQTRPALLVLLLCALLLRTFVPAGFMIAPAVSGAPALILCPDSAPVAPHHGQHQHQAPRHAESPCPYGALAAPALPETPLAFAPPMPPAPLAAEAARLDPLRPALAAPPPPATGPPVSLRI